MISLTARTFRGWIFVFPPEGVLYFIEINPLPGLAPGYSDFPMLAEFNGMDYVSLVRYVLNSALKRYGLHFLFVAGVIKMSSNLDVPDGMASHNAQWNDWKWQFSHRITCVEELSNVIRLSEKRKTGYRKMSQHFPNGNHALLCVSYGPY